MPKKKKTIKELEELIKKHKSLYYSGNPEISDPEYDALEEELRERDPENYALKLVGATPTEGEKVEHAQKMLSLAKTYDREELKKWIDKHDVLSMFKIDGVSCSLIYENGHLTLAKTRGDGTVGQNITDKVMWMSDVPKTISNKDRLIEVRGEMFCRERDFFYLAGEMEKRGLEKPTNQRNIVAGLIGRKENLSLARYISFQAFDLLDDDLNIKTELEKFKELKKEKIDTPDIVHHTDTGQIDEVIEEAQKFMAEGDYQIDGLVFTYNQLVQQYELGETSHHPRYKIAFKFEGESKTTTIQEIQWQVSRNGVLTPVAYVDKVELSGAWIHRVTLHNYGMVKQFEIKRGDKIQIIRSGEVIPKFLSVVEASDQKLSFPDKCPVCESDVEPVEIRLYCTNPKCPARMREGILNFIRKIGIDDISSKRLDEMMSKKLVREIPDLYKLEKEDFYKLDKVKEKLADRLYKSIQKTKKVDLVTFLASLGITGGAFSKCEKIVQYGFDTIDKIKGLTVDDLMTVESFGEKSSIEFLKSLQRKHELIDKLLDLGFEIQAEEKEESAVTGLKICITGALMEKRSVIEDRIRKHGGIPVSSVSKNTDYLVTNENNPNSSKYKNAQKYDVPIISENKLREMIQ